MSKRLIPLVRIFTAVALLFAAGNQAQAARVPPGFPIENESDSEQPNIVFILTDDQRYDALGYMPTVRRELVRKGMRFTNYFVTEPLCCPSRASTLTGQWPHTTGVYANSGTHGGFRAFAPKEGSTIATWLDAAGYRTGLVGKYLNGYNVTAISHVPAGWDYWRALWRYDYFGPGLSIDGTRRDYPTSEYQTDVLADLAVEFIENSPESQPVFLWFAPFAPHRPATPPDRYKHGFGNLRPHRPPSFNEEDPSDKPSFVREKPVLSEVDIDVIDETRKLQYRSLLAVDDAVERILDALTSTGRLSNTMIVYASDDGLMWGEHRLQFIKSVPYEESIHVPLVVRWDGRVPPGTRSSRLALNVDLAATWAEVGGASSEAEGTSLMPLLTQEPGSLAWRTDFLIEHSSNPLVAPPYCAVRTADKFIYINYFSEGEEELYDLKADPYQLENQIFNPSYAAKARALRQRTLDLCRPLPPTGE